ncbi:MAG: HAMP domain-containing histidine kinase [Firmicutes bacterium]|nr:HAMP domain-containing histidine kinase [Bacillota bacterium]
MTPDRQPVDLGSLLRKAVESVALLAGGKGVALSARGPDEPCLLQGDEHLLTRAVENLLDNALRHTPPGGTIHVEWRRETDGYAFTVTDSGPGFKPHDLPHVFTPLFRGKDSRNRRTGGTGLGLTVAQRILRAHGGDLSAANAPSGGAVLTPVCRQSEPGGAASETRLRRSNPGEATQSQKVCPPVYHSLTVP